MLGRTAAYDESDSILGESKLRGQTNSWGLTWGLLSHGGTKLLFLNGNAGTSGSP